MDNDDETYILLLLSDSNLPTGSFVASSGLESYIKHGFLSTPTTSITTFIQDSLGAYARSALPFVSDAHRVVATFKSDKKEGVDTHQVKALKDLTALDDLYNVMTLNHVARRASTAQGVALLTLHSKGFSEPPSLSGTRRSDHDHHVRDLLESFKLMVRKEETQGHLPICWGALTAALGLSLERSQYLHLFLHARSLLSAAVRLNEIGPYSAQQILMHVARPIISNEAKRCENLHTGILEGSNNGFEESTYGPANTWPLGEILAARHDLQHSRIFNS